VTAKTQLCQRVGRAKLGVKREKRAIILGGGVAGTSAAHELKKKGVDVREARIFQEGRPVAFLLKVRSNGRKDLLENTANFPRFYKHIDDTMKRIPYKIKPNGVYGNLIEIDQ